MSDEQVPPAPALRLKPRLRPADGQPPAVNPSAGNLAAFPPPPPLISSPAASTVDVPIPEAPPPPRIQLKPKLESTPSVPAEIPAPSLKPAALSGGPEAFASVTPPSPMANPHVTAPSPPAFVSPPVTASPPLFITDPVPVAAAPESAPPQAPGADAGKFKLKPKVPSPNAPPPPAMIGALPPASANPPVVAPPVIGAPPPVAPPKPSLPFPVAPPPGVVKPPPPVSMPPAVAPARSLGSTPPMAKPPAPRRSEPPKSSRTLVMLVALVVVGGAFAWQRFMSDDPAPAAAAKPAATPPTSADDPSPTPSETLNRLAHAPANAINQAQETIANRRASGQARIDAAVLGEDLPDRPVAPPPSEAAKQTSSGAGAKSSTTTTTVAPGVTATTRVEAAAEASAPFRSFVANAKVSGVFQGTPPRAVINGKLTRQGDMVDAGLGITFDGIDSGRRHLLFKDKTGATVSRRY